MGARNVRIAKELEEELRYIQEEMKRKIIDIDLSKSQASKIAARILNERRANINNLINNGVSIKKSKGRRINKLMM